MSRSAALTELAALAQVTPASEWGALGVFFAAPVDLELLRGAVDENGYSAVASFDTSDLELDLVATPPIQAELDQIAGLAASPWGLVG